MFDVTRIQTDKGELQRFNDQVVKSFTALKSIPFLDGHLLEDIEVDSAQDTNISHKLGRKLRGWIIVRINATATVSDRQSDSDVDETRTLRLRASAGVTVSLWVF